MEFILKTDLNLLPKSIDFNFEEIKTELTGKLEYYNTLVVTEDSIKEAKNDKANLNKLKLVIDNRRKEIKKQYLEPYEALEKQCKELISLIDSPVKSIDSQLQVFEDKLLQEKWILIEDYYKAEVKELETLVPLEKILPQKWRNKTENLENICNSIGDELDRIRNELSTIKNLNSEYKDNMIDVYINGGYNLNKALSEQKRLEEQKKALEAAEKAKAAVKIETPAPIPAKIEVAPAPEPQKIEVTAPVTEKKYKVNFSVIGSAEDIKKLGGFMRDNNINYEVIK